MYESEPVMHAAGLRIPGRLSYAIKFLRGEAAGIEWLEALDAVLQHYQQRWDLHYEAIAEGGAMSCCAYCVNDADTDLVLKVPVDTAAGVSEARTLRFWESTTIVPRVLESDPTTGVFLMERLRPGTTYTGIGTLDDVSTFVVMFQLLAEAGTRDAWAAVPPLSALIHDRLTWAEERFVQPDIAHLRPDLDRARSIAITLEDRAASRLVHGDLQAKNLMWGPDRALYCIDPFTAIGDPASDAAMWAVLQDSTVPIPPILERLARELELPLSRLEDWAYVIAVAELRPLAPERFARQRAFLEAYETARA